MYLNINWYTLNINWYAGFSGCQQSPGSLDSAGAGTLGASTRWDQRVSAPTGYNNINNNNLLFLLKLLLIINWVNFEPPFSGLFVTPPLGWVINPPLGGL